VDLAYWFLFPISIGIGFLANGAGIGGATFFTPLFILVLGLEPQVAVGVALITEVFGFASGVSAHTRARTIDWKVARMLAVVSVPAAVVGSLVAGYVPPELLKLLLGLGLLVIAAVFIRHSDVQEEMAAISRGEGVVQPSTSRRIVTRDGETLDYELCRHNEGRWFAGVGGTFVGLISTGLGELNNYALVIRCRIPTRVTVATSAAVVAVTALAASVTHFVGFVQDGGDTLDIILSIVIFTVPGVIIGGQLAPKLSQRVKGEDLIRFLGWLFLAVGLLTLAEVALG
jgi:uncharacterized membrane protein YfcA